MTREEGEKDRRRSVLTRCIGACPETVAEYQRGTIRQDAMYLLYTDGFWHGNAPERLQRISLRSFSPGKSRCEGRKKGDGPEPETRGEG